MDAKLGFLLCTVGFSLAQSTAPSTELSTVALQTLSQTAVTPTVSTQGGFRGRSEFIVPEHHSDDVDKFTHRQTEYLVIDRRTTFQLASMVCKHDYGSELATLKDIEVADFMAEALSETNLVMDALWVAGRRSASNSWEWLKGGDAEVISSSILKLTAFNRKVNATDRDCLAFARLDYDQPQFRPLSCDARRSILCERPVGGGKTDQETHPGWIPVGKRLYKIFMEPIPHHAGESKCFKHDVDARLAVVATFEDAQHLGRYLLIGRPSLENAWIGAKWGQQGAFVFDDENLVLSNASDATGYPPWRKGKLQKSGGCVLLDRHLADVTLFVEARCQRLRPYICYKRMDAAETTPTDVIIGDLGYRMILNKMSWADASDFCNLTYAEYGAKLSEIRSPNQTSDLLYVMGENRTDANHIWLGGIYKETGVGWQWLWVSDNSEIELGLLNMVKNTTYNSDIEVGNTCLNMDRENHITALHYGTFCEYAQVFVCVFAADKLRQLENDEAKNGTRR